MPGFLKEPRVCPTCGKDFKVRRHDAEKRGDGKFCSRKCVQVIRPMEHTLKRFFSKVKKSSSCWNWTAAKDPLGYGHFRTGMLRAGTRRTTKAHRFSYEYSKGKIPEGLVLDHLCRNPSCVNPKHLEAVTQKVNTRRAFALKTKCIHGHRYTKANTALYRNKSGGLTRFCKTCSRQRGLSRYREQRAKLREGDGK